MGLHFHLDALSLVFPCVPCCCIQHRLVITCAPGTILLLLSFTAITSDPSLPGFWTTTTSSGGKLCARRCNCCSNLRLRR